VLLGAYLVGALLAMASISEFAPRFSEEDAVPRRGLYVFIGAALWPVLLIGVIQILGVAAYARRVQAAASH
jgi:hypothetical protein